MDETDTASERPEVAYYYPEPYWHSGEVDRLKTLLLFFDEIAILLPNYMRGRESTADPVLAAPLSEAGLLRVLEPETFVDQQATEELSTALVQLITGGAFDGLETEVHFAELSRSRMGWNADVSLAGMVVAELESRGLARPSEDGVSVPLHPVVRSTVLVLLAQLARNTGRRHGLNLHPTTSSRSATAALMQSLGRPSMPSAGHLVAVDLEVVGVDLAAVPLDEVLEFRAENGESYRAYAREIREVLIQLGGLPAPERAQVLLDRQEALADDAADLRCTARRAWRLPFASFSLGVAGATWEVFGNQDPVTALLALGSGVAGALSAGSQEAGAYSYLFDAQGSFSNR